LHLQSVLRYWWLVLVVFVVAVVAAVTISSQETKQYDATANVLLTSSEPVNVLQHSSSPVSADPERDLNTDITLVKVNPVVLGVKRQLKLKSWTVEQLRREVLAAPAGTSNVIAITARDLSPRRAAAIANAFAAHYIAFRRASAQAQYGAAARLARTQLAALTPAQRRQPDGVALRQQLLELETAGSLQTGAAQLVSRATVPLTPATPRTKFDAAVAGFGGLVIGVLAAMALGALRRSEEAKEQEAPVPPAGTRRRGPRSVAGEGVPAASSPVSALPQALRKKPRRVV
jgi:uncharacterized protein involved in exopolysaccharide biosynthesis